MKKISFVSGLLLVLGLVGCGGDDLKSVDRDKSMSEISVAESQTICENVAASVDTGAMVRGSCYLAGLLASSFDESISCEDTAQECIDEAGSEGIDLACESLTQADVDALPACAAMVTLGEFQDCQIALAEASVDFFEQITCESEEVPIEEAPLPASCQAISTNCSVLLDGI